MRCRDKAHPEANTSEAGPSQPPGTLLALSNAWGALNTAQASEPFSSGETSLIGAFRIQRKASAHTRNRSNSSNATVYVWDDPADEEACAVQTPSPDP